MEQIFHLKIDDKISLIKLLEWYNQYSLSSNYIRDEIIEEHRQRDGCRGLNSKPYPLCDIVCGRPKEVPDLMSL